MGHIITYRHNIERLISDLRKEINDQKCEYINDKIHQIIRNEYIKNLKNYVDFKYNFDEIQTIVNDNKINEHEKEIIEEVIECLKQ